MFFFSLMMSQECGNSSVRCGIHTTDGKDSYTPALVEPSVVGRPIFSSTQVPHLASDKLVYVGNDCISKSGILKLSFPIEDGVVSFFPSSLFSPWGLNIFCIFNFRITCLIFLSIQVLTDSNTDNKLGRPRSTD